MTLAQEFINQSVFRMRESAERITKCLSYFNDAAVWERSGPQSNSMGNLALHLCGNITQYILTALGGQPDNRRRDAEFAADGGYTRNELAGAIAAVIEAACRTIEGLPENELLRIRPVQCYEMSGMAIIIHVVEHLSYHTGQLAFYTKQRFYKDLGFYAGQDLGKTV